jgi:hypothetical protein
MVILLSIINGYSIDGYWYLFYCLLLMVILSMVIGIYFIAYY